MTRTPSLVHALCAVGAVLALGGAKAEQDPFREASVVDAIGIARLADEAGDTALENALDEPSKRERALMAARAAPSAAAPESLIPALVALAGGRDPELAAEAANALLAIGQRLTPSELADREVLLADLSIAHGIVEKAIEAADHVRPDILACLSDLNAQLGSLEAALKSP